MTGARRPQSQAQAGTQLTAARVESLNDLSVREISRHIEECPTKDDCQKKIASA